MCSKIAKRRRRGGGVTIISYYRENPIHETTREGINDLLADVHEVDDDRFPAPDNKPSLTGTEMEWHIPQEGSRRLTQCSETL